MSRLDRTLAGAVAGGLFLLGVAELIARIDEPATLLFWLPTLWGGATLVFLGSFRRRGSTSLSKTFVILGALLGFVPSAWTVVLPILIVALVVRAAFHKADSEAPATV